MQSKFAYTYPETVHAQKNGKNVCKIHVVYRFTCFWGQAFQKCNQNFHTLAQGPCTCKKIAKMCAKYMLYIDLNVFEAKNFKNATKNSASFIESIPLFIINSFFDSSAILFKHSFLIIVYTSLFYLQTLKKIACSLFSYLKCLNN